MTDETRADPPVEDILASIRRMISDDRESSADATEDDPQDSPMSDVEALKNGAAQGREDPPAMAPESVAAARAALDRLAAVARDEVHERTAVAASKRSIEDLATELLRPMLKDWMDDNLPVIVERLVAAEIKRLTGPSD